MCFLLSTELISTTLLFSPAGIVFSSLLFTTAPVLLIPASVFFSLLLFAITAVFFVSAVLLPAMLTLILVSLLLGEAETHIAR
jgi:O-antigen ligase